MTDAQSVRLTAAKMGWEVGIASSMATSSVIRAKTVLYPKGKVTLCLKETEEEELKYRAQSSSADSGKAKWRSIYAKKKTP